MFDHIDIFSFLKKARRSSVGRLRAFRFRLFNRSINISSGFFCGKGCSMSRGCLVSIGENFYMGNRCNIGASITIGRDVLFASNVAVVGGDHRIDGIDVPIRLAGREPELMTVIEDNVWIGHGAIIMRGIRVHQGAVIAAGAVVTRDVDSNQVVGGNPAKIIRLRN